MFCIISSLQRGAWCCSGVQQAADPLAGWRSETNLERQPPRRHLVTRAAAAAVRRRQPCAKLICLSSRLRVAEADRGGIIELGIISSFFFFFRFAVVVAHRYRVWISQPIFSLSLLCCLSACRWRRHADNWMKNTSCVGGGLLVRAVCSFGAWLRFARNKSSVFLIVCADSAGLLAP